jgi:hypothetical protein
MTQSVIFPPTTNQLALPTWFSIQLRARLPLMAALHGVHVGAVSCHESWSVLPASHDVCTHLAHFTLV